MKKAYTLLELLIVVVIIGILASISMVAYPTAINKAKEARIKADLREVFKVESAYRMVYGKWVNIGNDKEVNIDLDNDGTNDIIFKLSKSPTFSYSLSGDFFTIKDKKNKKLGFKLNLNTGEILSIV